MHDDAGRAGATATVAAAPGIAGLFGAFFLLGLMGFGGVLPLARDMIVERRRWMTNTEFTELLGLCQFLPGGNVINLSVALGTRFAGLPGAAAALLGLITAPCIIVVLLGGIYDRYGGDPHVRHLFAGLAAAAAGLLVALALRLAAPLRTDLRSAGLAVLCFLAIALLRLPLLPTLLVLVPLSVLVLRREA
ncbi:chromate transporter [Roseomonas sp. NAR14]|uniref:Chromate transporter n=1 Tax=Roseomonas acroporae TaxID=2937791 RepID=A0A9X2BXL9_9PROT|nr:chromate transporter [Roseomonas acroporae]MCK8785100.1 chromate transporter [Roseomonas acroporae]